MKRALALLLVSALSLSLLSGCSAGPAAEQLSAEPISLTAQELAAHGLQNRTVALLQNGSWAPVSAKCMSEQLAGLKNTRILEETVTLKSALKEEQLEQLELQVQIFVLNQHHLFVI